MVFDGAGGNEQFGGDLHVGVAGRGPGELPRSSCGVSSGEVPTPRLRTRSPVASSSWRARLAKAVSAHVCEHAVGGAELVRGRRSCAFDGGATRHRAGGPEPARRPCGWFRAARSPLGVQLIGVVTSEECSTPGETVHVPGCTARWGPFGQAVDGLADECPVGIARSHGRFDDVGRDLGVRCRPGRSSLRRREPRSFAVLHRRRGRARARRGGRTAPRNPEPSSAAFWMTVRALAWVLADRGLGWRPPPAASFRCSSDVPPRPSFTSTASARSMSAASNRPAQTSSVARALSTTASHMSVPCPTGWHGPGGPSNLLCAWSSHRARVAKTANWTHRISRSADISRLLIAVTATRSSGGRSHETGGQIRFRRRRGAGQRWALRRRVPGAARTASVTALIT